MIWLVAVFLALIPPALSACGGSITLSPESSSTTFSVPKDSNGYHETPTSCAWEIAAPSTATELKLDCQIDIYSSSGCPYVTFWYTEGSTKSGICGTGTLTKTLSGSSTKVEFDSYISYNYWYTGAQCTVSYTPSSGSGTSGGEETDTSGGEETDTSGGEETDTSGGEETDTSGDDTCTCGYKGGRRIVGGNEATANEYPWQALLAYTSSGQQFCGGSLISSQWILTAAHCVPGLQPSNVMVSLGEHDYSTADSSTQKIEVEKIISHENYNSDTLVNDIALIKLKTPATVNRVVSTICLPFNYKDVNLSGKTGTLSGWGLTKHGDYSSGSKVLKEVDLKFLTNTECSSSNYVWASSQITENMICGLKEEAGACQGDSGGPFVWLNPDNSLYFQMGVVSFGADCAQNTAPSVYTKVQNYVDWIKQNTGATDADGLCTKK